jgi:serine/threonine protein kinase/beta-lactam-binding protein with PASTA domain
MLVDRDLVAGALPAIEIGDELGAGAFGLVLAGRHRGLRRDVAIKVLSAERDLDGEFAAEAQLLARLDHPHVVRVFDYAETGRLRLIVMELLAGGTLTDRLAELSPRASCAVGLGVASGLAHAHRQGVVHRDIKPDNVMFDAADNIKVTDFGIAKMFQGTATTAGGQVGTPMYMAPEQVLGGRVGPASDIYSLGVLMYRLLAGRPPFDASSSPHAIWYQQVAVLPAPPEGVPAVLAEVVLRAMAKEPADRHSSATAFARDLAAAAATAFGPGWLTQAGLPLRLDDDVRDAAVGLATASAAAPAAYHGGADLGSADDAATNVLSPVAVSVAGPFRPLDLPAGDGSHAPRDSGESGRFASASRDRGPHGSVASSGPADGRISGGSGGPSGPTSQSGDEARRAPSRRPLWWTLGGLVAIAALVAAIVTVPSLLRADATTTVPVLAGLDRADAESALRRAGFTWAYGTAVVSAEVQRGHVVSQSPGSTARLASGGRVTLVLSLGAAVTVPHLTGLTTAQATAALRRAGLGVSGTRTEPSDTATGTVTGTDPGVGTKVDPGARVLLLLSAGRPAALARIPPDLLGAPVAQARSRLTDLGFIDVRVQRAPRADATPDTVTAVDPAPGSSVRTDAAITLTVATAPAVVAPTVVVPNVVGRDQQGADLAMAEAGFTTSVLAATGSAGQKPGTVVRTDPPAGHTAPKDSVVTLYVVDPVISVPDEIGKQLADAEADLTKNGLKYTVKGSPGAWAPLGSVVEQSPNPDTGAHQGDTIELIVATGPTAPPT